MPADEENRSRSTIIFYIIKYIQTYIEVKFVDMVFLPALRARIHGLYVHSKYRDSKSTTSRLNYRRFNHCCSHSTVVVACRRCLQPTASRLRTTWGDNLVARSQIAVYCPCKRTLTLQMSLLMIHWYGTDGSQIRWLHCPAISQYWCDAPDTHQLLKK